MFFIFLFIFYFFTSQKTYAESSYLSINECGFYLPSRSIKFPHVCTEPRVSLQNTLIGRKKWDYSLLLDSSLYVGIHGTRWISAHAKGHYQASLYHTPNHSQKNKMPNDLTKPTPLEYLYMHLGSPSKDKIQLSIGKIETNFGINRKIIPSLLINNLKTNSYSQRSDHGVILLLDNQRELSLEIGSFTSKESAKKLLDNPSDKEESFKSELYGRLMVDTSVLEGSRWIVSIGNEFNNVRSIGVGFAVLSPEGHGGTLEWQQRYPSYLFKKNGEQQIINFQYKSEARLNSRWLFELENFRKLYLLTSLFHEYEIFSHFYLTSGIAYRKPWSLELEALWIASIGLDLKI